jgi:hypothetical protein
MNIIASIQIGDHRITSTYRTEEHEGEPYIVFTTTDEGSLAALKLDPDQIRELPRDLGAPASHFYKGVLPLKDVVVIARQIRTLRLSAMISQYFNL